MSPLSIDRRVGSWPSAAPMRKTTSYSRPLAWWTVV